MREREREQLGKMALEVVGEKKRKGEREREIKGETREHPQKMGKRYL